MFYSYDEKTEGFPFVIYDDTTLVFLEINQIGVVDSSKRLEELGSKEAATLGISDWANKVISEGAIIGTNLGIYK